jgi:hypothetical protein
VSFTYRSGRRGRPDIESRDVVGWLIQLRRRGIGRLRLQVPSSEETYVAGQKVSQHIVAAFVNGGQWNIIALGSRHSELWRAFWTAGTRAEPHHRIWSVTYEGSELHARVPDPLPLDVAAVELRGALQDIRNFAASEQDWTSWVRRFDEALTPADEIPYHDDMLPGDWDRPARQLAAAAARSWVFGGMGSWNDIVPRPEIREGYERVTRRLYSAVLSALSACVEPRQAMGESTD